MDVARSLPVHLDQEDDAVVGELGAGMADGGGRIAHVVQGVEEADDVEGATVVVDGGRHLVARPGADLLCGGDRSGPGHGRRVEVVAVERRARLPHPAAGRRTGGQGHRRRSRRRGVAAEPLQHQSLVARRRLRQGRRVGVTELVEGGVEAQPIADGDHRDEAGTRQLVDQPPEAEVEPSGPILDQVVRGARRCADREQSTATALR